MAREQFSKPRYSPYPSQQRQAPKPFFQGDETISSPPKERTAFPDIPSLIAQVNNYSQVIDRCIKPYLLNCIDCFVGGQISQYLPKWISITSDPTILQIVQGDKIEFLGQPPTQNACPRNHIAREHALEIDSEINGLIKKQVIRECNHVHGEFLSPIFSVPKKDGKVRLILNLKNLNQHIPYEHFKMDSIFSALELITQECWMASLDLKDAYYSVKIQGDKIEFLGQFGD